ncbi:MAG: septum formation initiator family protein [Rhodothermaceae bacterium]
MNKRSLKLYLFLGVIGILSLYLVFNDDGLIQYLSLKSEVEAIESEIEKIDEKIARLEKEIDSLKNDPIKLEKIARKKYYMKLKNEKLIQIKEK